MTIRKIRCRKCNNSENMYVEEETRLDAGKFSVQNTFFCKDCERLTLLDTVKEKLNCKQCRSANIAKFFPLNKARCAKCGNQSFDETAGVEF